MTGSQKDEGIEKLLVLIEKLAGEDASRVFEVMY